MSSAHVEVEINIKNAVADKAIVHSKRFLSDVGDELQNGTAKNIKRALTVKVVCWR